MSTFILNKMPRIYVPTIGIWLLSAHQRSRVPRYMHAYGEYQHFMSPLPQSNNFNYLLVIIDQLTLQTHLVPTTTTITAKGVM